MKMMFGRLLWSADDGAASTAEAGGHIEQAPSAQAIEIEIGRIGFTLFN